MQKFNLDFLDNSKLVGLKFRSEKGFNKAVDVLFNKHEFDVPGDDVLIVLKSDMQKIKALLKKNNSSFIEIPIVSRSELTEKERRIIYTERKK